MTITLKARTAAIVLALLCILAGLAIGQLTQAQSAGGEMAQLRAISSKLGKLNQIDAKLRTISSQLGSPYGQDIETKLDDIERNTDRTCAAVKDRLTC